jgi:tryptophanyl-tRNA synthetase
VSDTFQAAQARSSEIERTIDREPDSLRMLTGDRPTGALHVGHYFGSIRNRIRLQQAGVEILQLVADYQVITDREGVGDIGANVRNLLLDNIAAGLDPDRCTIFAHSAVPALNQLLLPFLSLVSVAELQRNPTVKDEAASAGISSISGLMLTYPVHQAADILFCKANVVPVGRDQLPHLEQTRVVARRFNDRYAPVFPEPGALLSEAPLILGTDGTKMSKSKGNVVELRMSADETAKKLKGAKTDSDRVITYDPDGRPEVANLLTLIGLCESTRRPSPRRSATEAAGRSRAASPRRSTPSSPRCGPAVPSSRRTRATSTRCSAAATPAPTRSPRPRSTRCARPWAWSTAGREPGAPGPRPGSDGPADVLGDQVGCRVDPPQLLTPPEQLDHRAGVAVGQLPATLHLPRDLVLVHDVPLRKMLGGLSTLMDWIVTSLGYAGVPPVLTPRNINGKGVHGPARNATRIRRVRRLVPARGGRPTAAGWPPRRWRGRARPGRGREAPSRPR